jgi:hypothetical protein
VKTNITPIPHDPCFYRRPMYFGRPPCEWALHGTQWDIMGLYG